MRNKTKISRYAAAAMAAAIAVSAADIMTADALRYRIEELAYETLDRDSFLTLTECSKDASGKIVVPDNINGRTVGAAAEEVFSHCGSIEKVYLPDSMTEVGRGAFSYCCGLKTAALPAGLEVIEGAMFSYCQELKEVSMPSALTEIESSAFFNCSSLASVSIPVGVTEIGSAAFAGSGLKEVWYAGTKEQWESISIGDMNEPLTSAEIHFSSSDPVGFGKLLKDGVTYDITGDSAAVVSGSSELSGELVIPGSLETEEGAMEVTSIADGAFEGCTGITAAVIPDSVTKIGSKAFCGCKSLEKVSVSTLNIGSQAFSGTKAAEDGLAENGYALIGSVIVDGSLCTGDAVLPEEVKAVSAGAFSGCKGLGSVTVMNDGCRLPDNVFPAGVKLIGNFGSTVNKYAVSFGHDFVSVDGGDIFRKDGIVYQVYSDHAEVQFCEATDYESGSGELSEVIIPREVCGVPVTVIGKGAFSAEKVPESYVPVDENFNPYYMNTIYRVVLPDTVTAIGEYAFYNSFVDQIQIPISVTHIGAEAFTGTNFLETLVERNDVKTADSMTEIDEKKMCAVINGILVYCIIDHGDIVIKTDAERIAGQPFGANDRVCTVTLPEGVKYLDEKTFFGLDELDTLYLPASLEEFPTELLPESLEDVYYAGSSKQWEKLGAKLRDGVRVHYDSPAAVPVSLIKDGDIIYRVYDDHAEVASSSYYVKAATSVKGEISGVPVTRIGAYAFNYTDGLNQFSIPDTITDIGKCAFMNSELKKIVLPEGLKTIGAYAFKGCMSLTMPDIPEGVIIGEGAFDGLSRLSGDANCDGKINVSDAVAVLQYIANKGKYPLEDWGSTNADCDGESGITGGDALAIQQYDAGIIEKLPLG